MPKRTKLSITDWGHAKPPDFSIPAPVLQNTTTRQRSTMERRLAIIGRRRNLTVPPGTRRPTITPTSRMRTTSAGCSKPKRLRGLT